MFTVVIPAHNAEATLSHALASVARQTLLPNEVLVIDDASVDRTVDVAARFQNDLPLRILLRDEPGPGGYAARNHGVALAQNQWIAFLDSDDTWADEHLSTLDAALRDHPHHRFAATGRLLATQESDRPRHADFHTLAAQRPYHDLDANDLLSEMLAGQSPALTSCVAVTKEAFNQAGGFPAGKAKRGGDEDLWVRLSICGYNLLRINKPTTSYTCGRPGSVTNDKSNIQGSHPIYETAEAAKKTRIDPIIIKKLDSLSNEKQLSWLRDAGRFRNKAQALKTLSLLKLTPRGRTRLLLWLVVPAFIERTIRLLYRASRRKLTVSASSNRS